MSVVTLEDIPPYNSDMEGDLPEPVKDLRSIIGQSAGIIVASPEYNWGMPGQLKNAIDWASRPAFRSPLFGKPVLLFTCSLHSATIAVRAHAQLRETFASTGARVLARKHGYVRGFEEDVRRGIVIGEASIDGVCDSLDALLHEIALVSRPVSGPIHRARRMETRNISG
jgi:chromate reductase